jgi:hypothetical protein
VIILGLLAGALVVAQQIRAGRRLQQELATLRKQKLELARLTEENRALAAKLVSQEELERMRRRQRKTGNGGVRFGPTTGQPSPGSASGTVAQAEIIPATEWKFAGRETPRATFESALWAATHQEVDQLAALLCFDAKTQAEADAFFAQLPEETRAQYGSPAKIVATLVAATLPDNLSGMGVLSDSANSTKEDNASLLMQIQRSDGSKKDSFFAFQRAPDGWQLVVPPEVLASYQRKLTRPAKAPADAQKP